MSSHREAPEISKDPVADSTDLYAFVSPDQPDSVTIIANYVPLESPDGGPNFYEFGDDVLYAINIDNDNDGGPISVISSNSPVRSPTRTPSSTTQVRSRSLQSPSWNRRQTYSVTRSTGTAATSSGHEYPLPALQHRAALNSRLRGFVQSGRSLPSPAGQGLRRPTSRGLLRGPRRHLRPW